MGWIEFIVCMFAGIGAGIGTGFAGMSAAAFIAPMLITFLGVPAYEAIGIALISDVLASAVSSVEYGVKKNIDFKIGGIMLVIVMAFTILGSVFASTVSNNAMSGFSLAMTTLLGVKFIVKPIVAKDPLTQPMSVGKVERGLKLVVSSVLIGLICGFMGAGGGMMMLLMLTSYLGLELKRAVGTSVFVMTFTALTGAVSHFVITGLPNMDIMLVCILFTLVAAQISAKIANKSRPTVLNRVTGGILLALGVSMLIVNAI